jgi:uncharacterized SAM-binding protein YcdF (DUF218 family)
LIYLHKILPFFLSPLGFIILFLIVSVFFRQRLMVLISLLILLISSNAYVGNYLFSTLEDPYKPLSMNSINESDAVVVLSGMINQVGKKENIKYEWSDPDRFFAGVKLIKNNKSKLLIFTAGQLPWTKNWRPEGDILKDKAIEFGIDKNKILVSAIVQNTYEESLSILELIPRGSSIILVTSAFHMERSKLLFEKQGFEVNPFPVDFKISNNDLTILDIIPSLGAMSKTSLFIRENIGRLYYKVIL